MKMIFYHLSMFTIALGFAIIALLMVWSFYPYKILTFGEGNATLLDTTVRSGDYLSMRQVSCKYMNIESTIDRQFIDSIVYQVPLVSNNRPLGCFDKVELIYVPKALPPGDYMISTVISFKVNPIRTMKYTVRTGMFTVTR